MSKTAWIPLFFAAVLFTAGFYVRWQIAHNPVASMHHHMKDVRHYQHPKFMVEFKNPFVGVTNWSYPVDKDEFVWYRSLSETPLLNWVGIINFALFSRTDFNYRMGNGILNLAVAVLFYLLFRKHLGNWLVLFPTAALLFMPLFFYYSTHGIGEQALLLPQVLLLYSMMRLFMTNFQYWRPWLLFIFTLPLLVLGKVSHGYIIAISSLGIMGGLGFTQHYNLLRRKYTELSLSYRFLCTLVLILFGGAIAAFTVFFLLTADNFSRSHSGRGIMASLATVKFYKTIFYAHWLPLLGYVFLSLITLRQLLAKRLVHVAFTKAALVLGYGSVLCLLIQLTAFKVHLYYSLVFFVPLAAFSVEGLLFVIRRRRWLYLLPLLFIFFCFLTVSSYSKFREALNTERWHEWEKRQQVFRDFFTEHRLGSLERVMVNFPHITGLFDAKVISLYLRNPSQIAWSYYHQWKKKMGVEIPFTISTLHYKSNIEQVRDKGFAVINGIKFALALKYRAKNYYNARYDIFKTDDLLAEFRYPKVTLGDGRFAQARIVHTEPTYKFFAHPGAKKPTVITYDLRQNIDSLAFRPYLAANSPGQVMCKVQVDGREVYRQRLNAKSSGKPAILDLRDAKTMSVIVDNDGRQDYDWLYFDLLDIQRADMPVDLPMPSIKLAENDPYAAFYVLQYWPTYAAFIHPGRQSPTEVEYDVKDISRMLVSGEIAKEKFGVVRCALIGDGEVIWSGIIDARTPLRDLELDLTKIEALKVRVDCADDSSDDHFIFKINEFEATEKKHAADG